MMGLGSEYILLQITGLGEYKTISQISPREGKLNVMNNIGEILTCIYSTWKVISIAFTHTLEVTEYTGCPTKHDSSMTNLRSTLIFEIISVI